MKQESEHRGRKVVVGCERGNMESGNPVDKRFEKQRNNKEREHGVGKD